jgi:hypothetical protein
MNGENCCCEKLHPCCVKYWKREVCTCPQDPSGCPTFESIPPEGCGGSFPLACIASPPLGNPLIAKWIFSDQNADPLSVAADIGVGTAVLEGPLTATFDQDATHSRYWRTSDYPEQGLDSGLGGVRFNVSTVLDPPNPTVGGVVFRFKIRVVPGSSAWFRVEYTTNGGSSWRIADPATKVIANFSSFFYHWSSEIAVAITNPAVLNNPNFGIRVVSVFSPEAFTERASNTLFSENTAYESCLNTFGASFNAPYVNTAPWGFDDVEISFISTAITTVPQCGEQDFVRSESGCFETQEDCYSYFEHLQPWSVEFFEDVNCDGQNIPQNDPELPADFCVVPSKKKLCPHWTCNCCGPTVACCTVEEFDTPCSSNEPPNCPLEDCCEPPTPINCCCITIIDDCTESRNCVLTYGERCSDLNVITEESQTYCIQVPDCDYCNPPLDCNIGITFTCQVPPCPLSPTYECYPTQNCCDECRGYDPVTGDCIEFVEICTNCFGRCELGNSGDFCCTAECAEAAGFGSCVGWTCPGTECGGPNDCWLDPPGAPCNPDLQGNGGYPGGFCFLNCQLSPDPEDVERISFPMTCEFCKKIPLGLCYVGNCPPWIWGFTMGVEESAAEKDLTNGIILDTKQQAAMNQLFLFGYGENFL